MLYLLMSWSTVLPSCANDIQELLKSHIAARTAARPTFRSDRIADLAAAVQHADEAKSKPDKESVIAITRTVNIIGELDAPARARFFNPRKERGKATSKDGNALREWGHPGLAGQCQLRSLTGHSITWSARSRLDMGTSRPSALAAFRLSKNCSLVGCSTSSSAGWHLSKSCRRKRPFRKVRAGAASPQSTDIAASMEKAVIASAGHELYLHLLVGELSALDDDVVIESDRAVAHRDVVVAPGRALAAALGVRAGGEQEIPGEAAGAGMVTHRIGAVERDGVPAALRVEPPAKMGDGVPVHVVRPRLVRVEPIAHQFGVEPARDAADEAVANLEPDFVLHITAIGKHHDIAGRQHDSAIGRSFVWEGVHVAGAPVIETAGQFRIAVLDHGGILAELHGEIGAAGARDAHGPGAFEPRAGMDRRILEAGGSHEAFELVRPVDDHEHPGAGVARLLQPAGEQGDVQAHQHVGGLD